MATGFRTYMDTPGSPVLVDMTTDISQVVGFIETGVNDGYADVPAPPSGRNFLYFMTEYAPNINCQGVRPGVSITPMGATYRISWQFKFSGWPGTYKINCRINYGHYV